MGRGDPVCAELAAVPPAAVPRAVEVDAAAGQSVADAETLPAVRLDRHEQRGGHSGGKSVGEIRARRGS